LKLSDLSRDVKSILKYVNILTRNRSIKVSVTSIFTLTTDFYEFLEIYTFLNYTQKIKQKILK